MLLRIMIAIAIDTIGHDEHVTTVILDSCARAGVAIFFTVAVVIMVFVVGPPVYGIDDLIVTARHPQFVEMQLIG